MYELTQEKTGPSCAACNNRNVLLECSLRRVRNAFNDTVDLHITRLRRCVCGRRSVGNGGGENTMNSKPFMALLQVEPLCRSSRDVGRAGIPGYRAPSGLGDVIVVRLAPKSGFPASENEQCLCTARHRGFPPEGFGDQPSDSPSPRRSFQRRKNAFREFQLQTSHLTSIAVWSLSHGCGPEDGDLPGHFRRGLILTLVLDADDVLSGRERAEASDRPGSYDGAV
jgi:hypothetical protein